MGLYLFHLLVLHVYRKVYHLLFQLFRSTSVSQMKIEFRNKLNYPVHIMYYRIRILGLLITLKLTINSSQFTGLSLFIDLSFFLLHLDLYLTPTTPTKCHRHDIITTVKQSNNYNSVLNTERKKKRIAEP